MEAAVAYRFCIVLRGVSPKIWREKGMPKTNTRANSRSIRRVAIDGHFLDDVQTRLHSDVSRKSLSYLSSPVERHHATEDEEGVTLRLPALTALQLYYDGVHVRQGRGICIRKSGISIGLILVSSARAICRSVSMDATKDVAP
jgi:hypothetical protein